jgi:hypothetical protein
MTGVTRFSVMTLSMTTFCVVTRSVTKKRDTQHNVDTVKLSIVILTDVYAEGRK